MAYRPMNSKTAATIFGLACVGFALAFFLRHASAVSRQREDQTTIVTLSNQVSTVSKDLETQKSVNLKIQRELDETAKDVVELTGQLSSAKTELTTVRSAAASAAELAKAELAKKDAEINKLESEKDSISRQMAGLSTQLADLEKKIAETTRQLAESNSDKKLLMDQLDKLQKEKAELERQFHDLALLREQVARLKEELSIAQRVEYIKQGLYNTIQKGGSYLAKDDFKKPITPLPARGGTNAQFSVEISRVGGVSNVTSLVPASTTNRPPGGR